MMAATHFWTLPAAERDSGAATAGPTPQRYRGPVFIHDAVIPLCGATLLLALMRAQADSGADHS